MYRKNVAGQYIYFVLVKAGDGTALTGATVTAYRALDNGSQASATGTTTELANGQYRFNLSQADTNADYGSYLFTAATAVPVEKTVVFTVANPSDAVNQIADAVWDEPYNQHTSAGSFGKLMDVLRKANLTIDGTVSTAITPTTLTFSSNVSAVTSAYAHAVLLFVSGPLAGENSPIISYNSTNGVFVLEEPLTAAPSNGDEFVVIAGSHVHAIADIQSGLALQTTSLAIKAKTDLITAGQVQIVSPVGAGGNITTPIFAGDDYLASNNRAFKWTIDARTGFSAGTATCRFGGSSEETGDSWNVSGTVSDIGGGEWELSFDLTKAVTATLSPGFYRWSVELVNPGGDEVTEVYNSNANRQAEVRAKQT